MTNYNYETGEKNLAKIDGGAGQHVVDSLADIAPDVGKYIIEFGFGEIYDRPGLNFRDREIVTLSSLLTQGDTDGQLKVHIRAALNVGLTQSEIVEIFIHCIPYVGFPKVLNAISTLK